LRPQYGNQQRAPVQTANVKSRAEKKAAVQSLNAARTSSVPFGSDLMGMGQREMSVSGNSFNMHNNFNTGYQMFQGAGGFGIDIQSDNQ
jgi:hypothetical protein